MSIQDAATLSDDSQGRTIAIGSAPSSRLGPRLSRTRRMRLLCVVESTNQLYSGIGRNMFEQASRLVDRAEIVFAIDDRNAKNVGLLKTFCARHGLPVHVGKASMVPGAFDPVNDRLPEILRGERWDAVEIVGWANAASHASVLDHLGSAALFYTPHHQPLWTVAMTPEEAAFVDAVHLRCLVRADAVLCDSPWERRELQARVPGRNHCMFLSLGCDFDLFQQGGLDRKPQLLFVGDLAEPRKRFDRTVGVFERLLRRWPGLRLVVVGNRSESALSHVPESIRHACETRGYIEEAELRRLYRESLGLFLLSDFEAFGLPTLEALVSGTPVYLSEQAATESLFRPFRGAHFCPIVEGDIDATAVVVEENLARGVEAIEEARRERDALRACFDWECLAVRKWNILATACLQRTHWSWQG